MSTKKIENSNSDGQEDLEISSSVELERDVENAEIFLTSEEKTVLSPEKSAKHFGEKDTEAFPEGGWGWMVVLGGFLILNTTYGMINTFGEYQVYYMATFPNTKSSVISLIGSLQPTIIYMSATPVVYFTNIMGVNYTIALGGFIMVFSLMMISICREVWQFFLAQGVLFSFGAGITFFTAMSVPPEWFKTKRALALGIIVSGSSLGGVIWPIAFHHLVDEVGFPWANRIFGFIYLPILSISSVLVKNRLPRPKQQVMPKWSVLKDYRLSIIAIGGTLGFCGLFPPLQYIVTYAQRLPASPNVQEYILAILNALSIIGRIAPSYAADKVGRLNVLIISMIFTGVFPLVLWLPAKSEALLLIFAIFWGIASGSFIALLPATVAQLFGIKDNASRLTVTFLYVAPGCLLGAAVAGTFIPTTANDLKGFDKLIIFSGVLMLAGSAVLIVARFCFTRKLMIFI